MDVFLQWAPLLGALGVGSVIGNYIGGGKARRETRSAVLSALAAVEDGRWVNKEQPDFSTFAKAIRDLDTAALIARVPRAAVTQYELLAYAALRYSIKDYEAKDGDEELGAGIVDSDLASVTRQSAELVAHLVWRPWSSRPMLRDDLRRLRNNAADIDDTEVKRQLAIAQFARGRSTGRLAKLYDDRYSAD